MINLAVTHLSLMLYLPNLILRLKVCARSEVFGGSRIWEILYVYGTVCGNTYVDASI